MRPTGLAKRGATERAGPTLTLAHCWAHVRRQYVEAEPAYPQAAEVLTLIAALYAADAAARETAAGDGTVLLEERRARVAPVVDAIRTWVMQQRALPQSTLGKALAYTTELWPGLVAFLDDAAIPVDNNATERALRGIALGRKNHYGSRSERGTRVAALCYSRRRISSRPPAGRSPRRTPSRSRAISGARSARDRAGIVASMHEPNTGVRRARTHHDLKRLAVRPGKPHHDLKRHPHPGEAIHDVKWLPKAHDHSSSNSRRISRAPSDGS